MFLCCVDFAADLLGFLSQATNRILLLFMCSYVLSNGCLFNLIHGVASACGTWTSHFMSFLLVLYLCMCEALSSAKRKDVRPLWDPQEAATNQLSNLSLTNLFVRPQRV